MTGISTLTQHIRMQELMRSTRGELNRLSREVASGTPDDYMKALGSDSQRGMGLRNTLQQLDFFTESAGIAQTQLRGQQQALTNLKELADDIREDLLRVGGGPAESAGRVLSEGAADYLRQARGILNQAVGGRFVFSGPATGTAPIRESDAANLAGDSPAGVLAAIKAGHDITTEQGMRDFLAEVHEAFTNTHANPAWTFDQVFYAGSTGGKLGAMVDNGVEVSLDARANDTAPRTVLEVLNVLAAVPIGETSTASYRVLAESMATLMTEGIGATVDFSAAIGVREQLVQRTLDRHTQEKTLLNNTISDLESIDDYAAASRLTTLQSQMEVTYTLTARLTNLSLVNFL